MIQWRDMQRRRRRTKHLSPVAATKRASRPRGGVGSDDTPTRRSSI
jgi:hypothetical protein